MIEAVAFGALIALVVILAVSWACDHRNLTRDRD